METVPTIAYLRDLVDYLYASKTLHPCEWNYPTKRDVEGGRKILQRLSALPLKSGKWSGEYRLLRARCAFALGRYAEVAKLWESSTKDATASWSPIFRNLYAGALVRLGRREEAVRIYAEQGDVQSLRYLVYQLRNLAGIRAEYAADPNSPLLPYLVEDLVTNVQETYDNSDDFTYLKEIDCAGVVEREQRDFIAFAQKVVAEKRSHSLAMWQSAIAMLHYYAGRYAEADRAAEAALSLSGTPLMRTKRPRRARLHLLVSPRHHRCHPRRRRARSAPLESRRQRGAFEPTPHAVDQTRFASRPLQSPPPF